MSLANFVQTSLSAAATAGATTLTLAAPTGAYALPPVDGGTLILTDSPGSPTKLEVITFTGRTGSGPTYTLTGVVRGVEGTVAQAWGVGAIVLGALTAGVLNTLLGAKQDTVAGKGLSTNDYTTAEKTKLTGVATGATANATDAQLRDRSTHTGMQASSTITGLDAALAAKVNTVAGKGLSTNDYTTAEKTKLTGVATGATANATDAQLRDRSTHTGMQASSTITGLDAALAARVNTSRITISTSDPSGGVDGDLWFKYTP